MVSELLMFENPEVVAVALGVLAFILVFYTLTKVTGNRGVSLIVGLAIGLMVTWGLFTGEFSIERTTLAWILIILAVAVVLKIFWAFIKGAKHTFR